LKNNKNKVACIPDSGRAVALGAPRSAFLADFQPAGASKSLPGLKSKKQQKTYTKTPICVYIGAAFTKIYIDIYAYIYLHI
jgi:hypothetical protein